MKSFKFKDNKQTSTNPRRFGKRRVIDLRLGVNAVRGKSGSVFALLWLEL